MSSSIAEAFHEAERKNEVLVMDDSTQNEESLISALTDDSISFSSFKTGSPERKAMLFNIMNNPTYRLKEKINNDITITDIYCEPVKLPNQETGKLMTCPRIVLIDENGDGYSSVSFGIYNAIKKLMRVFGPPTWEPALMLRVRNIDKGNNRNVLTLDVSPNYLKSMTKKK